MVTSSLLILILYGKAGAISRRLFRNMFYYFEAAVFENLYIPALLLGLLYLRIFTAPRYSEHLPTGMDITRIIYTESDVY